MPTPSEQLINHWDAILASQGFQDIEDRKTGMLKRHAGHHSINPSTQAPREGNLTFYTALTHYATRERKLTSTERKILKLTGEGLSSREIEEVTGTNYKQVQRTILKYQEEALCKYHAN